MSALIKHRRFCNEHIYLIYSKKGLKLSYWEGYYFRSKYQRQIDFTLLVTKLVYNFALTPTFV
jgi:hypothetical protein